MRLFKRISDVVSANLNDLVDRYEDPESMLNQAIREMEAAITSAMDSAAKVIASEKLLERRVQAHQNQARTQGLHAEATIYDGNDQQARVAIQQKLEHERVAETLTDQLQATRQSSRKLRRQIDAMHVRLAEARRKLTSLIARRRAAEARKQLALQLGSAHTESVAFSRFDRLCEKLELSEAEADAYVELTGCCDLDVTESAPAALDREIEAELQQLKQDRTGCAP